MLLSRGASLTYLLSTVSLLVQGSAAWLNVSTVQGGADVVSNGQVSNLWQREHVSNQSCSESWSDFYAEGPDYTLKRNSTNVSTSNSVATASMFKFSNDDSRVGVQVQCHQTGFTVINLTFTVADARASVFWGKHCVAYSVWYQLVDPGNLTMIAIAIILVTWAGLRVNTAFVQQVQQAAGNDAEISITKAFIFVIGASCSLLLIFYFLNILSVLLTISFSFVSTIAVAMLVYSVLQPTKLGANLQATAFQVPYFGDLNGLELGTFVVGVSVVLVWFVTRHWVANNILGMSICMYMMTVVRLSSIKVAAVLLSLLFFYDIFWVFYSQPIFGKNVMVTAAKGLDLPIKLVIPRILTPCNPNSYTMLGLGDIALPGLLVVFSRRFDLRQPQAEQHWIGYFHICVIGYALGMFTCFVVLFVFRAAQPALLYLVPGTLGSVVLTGVLRGDIRALWDGIESNQQAQNSEDVQGSAPQGDNAVLMEVEPLCTVDRDENGSIESKSDPAHEESERAFEVDSIIDSSGMEMKDV